MKVVIVQDHVLNATLNDCVSCSRDNPCAVTWGTEIKLEVYSALEI